MSFASVLASRAILSSAYAASMKGATRHRRLPTPAGLKTVGMNPACGIYIINLDRSPERLEMQQQQLDRLGLSFERVEAVDGSTLDLPHPALDEAGFRRRHGKTINPNELGCTLSHIRAIETFAKSQHDYAVILEDDADLSDAFESVVNATIEQSRRWDLVKLNRRHSGAPVMIAPLTPNHRLVVYLTKQSGGVGYRINRKAAEALLKGLLPMRIPYDHEFDRGHAHGLTVLGVVPPVVKDNLKIGSTIGYGYAGDNPSGKPLIKARKLPRLQRIPAYL
ncbi:MAG: glycosyltransferase family 25 protein, partial [Pseudomonadota bacterium]